MAWGWTMNAPGFHSALAEPIEQLIALRRLSGTDYLSQTRLLGAFDRYVATRSGITLPTSDLIEGYEKTLVSLAPRSRSNRMSVVRQLCQHIARNDPKAFVPPPMRARSSRADFKPYIYRDKDITALLRAAGELPGVLRAATYQTLIGLLYSTGLRIGEAMALNLTDCFDDLRLWVAQGKFRKARWVPVTSSTHRALMHYVNQRRSMAPNAPDAPLFLNERRRRLRHHIVATTFRRLLGQCQITGLAQRPRLHDLRHTFACHRLLAWYQEGVDINACLPALATYMGHVNTASTQAYLQPTTALLQQVNERFHRHYQRHLTPGDLQ